MLRDVLVHSVALIHLRAVHLNDNIYIIKNNDFILELVYNLVSNCIFSCCLSSSSLPVTAIIS